MTNQITDDEVGKRVVDANGEEIGMVTAVEGGTAYVEPDPGVTDSIKAMLGWTDVGDDAFALEATAVETVTADAIRLSSEDRIRGGTTTDDEGIIDRDEGLGRRGQGAESGEIGEPDADREPAGTETDASNASERDSDATSEMGADRTPDSVAGAEPDIGTEPDQEMGRGADERSTEAGHEPDRDPEGVRDRTDAEVEPDEEMRRDDASVEPTEGGRRVDAEIEPTGDPERTDAEMDPEAAGRSDDDSDDDREDTVTDARGRDEDR